MHVVNTKAYTKHKLLLKILRYTLILSFAYSQIFHIVASLCVFLTEHNKHSLKMSFMFLLEIVKHISYKNNSLLYPFWYVTVHEDPIYSYLLILSIVTFN